MVLEPGELRPGQQQYQEPAGLASASRSSFGLGSDEKRGWVTTLLLCLCEFAYFRFLV